MSINTLKGILSDLKKSRHRGLNSYPPCDLEKIGSPGKPYRSCTCGLDDRIAKLKKEIAARGRVKGKV